MAKRKAELMRQEFGYAPGLCRDCQHLIKSTFDKTYYKCAVYGTSASESTDWKISEIACGLINQEDVSMYKPIVKMVERNPKMPDAQVDGQISFF